MDPFGYLCCEDLNEHLQLAFLLCISGRRVSEFSLDMESRGGPFAVLEEAPVDRRAVALKAQLDELKLCYEGKPHRLATLAEALHVQELVEEMLFT